MALKESYKVIGVMSGTSLDGLDLACCNFKRYEKGWSFSILKAQTIRYSSRWIQKLSGAHLLSGAALVELDVSFGKFLGESIMKFMKNERFKIDFIASHGHTVFHQPPKSFTYQIGNGNAIHSVTGIPVINDFRSLDVMLGGEGAPLVPVGDRYLFAEYDVCVNLGGIANLSMEVNKQRKAFDVSFNNMALNYLAAKVGKEFDRNGSMASEGSLDERLLRKLTSIYSTLRKTRPSLGREIFEKKIKPLLDNEKIPVNDRLATVTESSAVEVMDAIPRSKKNQKVLLTGGGAFNAFFLSRLLDLSADRVTLIVPDEEIIKFKEAVVFGFLGVLRVRDEANCLRSVTGASRDNSGGVLVGF
jgi:anhydro-N-acetylmuramic acid kinase